MARMLDLIDRLTTVLYDAATAGTIALPGGVVQYVPDEQAGMAYPFVAIEINEEEPGEAAKQNWTGSMRIGCYTTYADPARLQYVAVELAHKVLQVIGANGSWTHSGVTLLPQGISYGVVRRDSGPLGAAIIRFECKYHEAVF